MSTPLTFGVEFEFLVPYLIKGTPDPSPQETPIDVIDPAAINARYDFDLTDAGEDAVRNRIESTIQNGGHPASQIDYEQIMPTDWNVDSDNTLHPDDRMEATYGETWTQVEIASPVLRLPRGAARMQQVCQLLRRNHRVHTPLSCGVHVHVGDENRGFSVSTLQNLAAFLWTFEKQFASLHPPHRQGGAYCKGMRRNSNLSSHRNNIPAGIDKIYSTPRVREIVALIHRTFVECSIEGNGHFDRFMAYNFTNLVFDNGRRTVEFRQFEGTMDGAEVANWVRCCVGLVQFAKETSKNVMRAFLKDEAAKVSASSVRQILVTIGMVESAMWAGGRSVRLYPNGFNL